MSSNALPPLQALTPNDHGAIVVVVAYCFAGFTVVGAGARSAITIVQKQGFHRDDIGYFGGAVSICFKPPDFEPLLTTLEVAGLHNECALRACCRRGSWTAYGRARCI
jgi:hypothetical protein